MNHNSRFIAGKIVFIKFNEGPSYDFSKISIAEIITNSNGQKITYIFENDIMTMVSIDNFETDELQ